MVNKIRAIIYSAVGIIALYLGVQAADYIRGLQNENERLHAELIGTKTEFKKLNEYVAELSSEYKKQSDLHNQARKEWAEISRKKDERIKLLSDATYLIGRHTERQNGPDYYYETPKRTRNYVLNELRIQGSDSPPIGYILIKSDGRTYKRNYEFEIQVKNLQTVDERTGKIKVYAKAFLVPKETSPLAKRVDGYQDWKDVSYPLKIKDGVALIDPTVLNRTPPKMHWWSPRINGSFDFASKTISPGLGVSLSGYGVSRNDLTYKFFRLGGHYNEQDGFEPTLTPAMWRPFSKVLPNTYIGPGVNFKNPGIGYFLGLQIGL